jgi:pimeloyl-ACP methyl ester carboxylesterase
VRLSTGVTLQVAEAGPADGEPVLFLHGYTDSWLSYSPVLERLPADIRAIVPTQRGHGDSEKPDCCYRPADFAADAVALLDAFGVERATVVGHSYGSFVAQRVAIDHPERVNGLVLIGSGTTGATPAMLELNDDVQALNDTLDPAFVRDFQASTAAEPLQPEFFERVVAESSKLPAPLWREVLGQLTSADMKHDLARIRARTLVIWGDQDALFDRSEQDGLLKAIPGAQLIVYPGIAHAPNWEDPDRFVADLENFLKTISAQTGAREHGQHDAHAHADSHHGPMPLLPGYGHWHYAVTTKSSQAQQYFDQGLRMTYAFNHDEAARSFEQAVQLDSVCAMCYWGIAYAVGPNINLPMAPDIEPRAFGAIRRAVQLRDGVTARERALIDAMAVRFGEPAGAARAARDSAYATAMRKVARTFPRDVDVQVLFADAMLNLRPWNQWTREGQPQPGTEELVVALESALRIEPNHAGACHFYVHAVEASETPERALPCAERLPRLMPGAGHIVHMPAHVYLRVGQYEQAARANIAAVEADKRYFAEHEATPGIYPLFYAPHNLHFLWSAYLLSGQQSKAAAAARALAERVAIDDARANAPLEAFLTTAMLTHARFGDWDAVLAEPTPPADLRYVKGIWHYARGLARAARGEVGVANTELDSVRTIAARVPADMIIILNPARALLGLAGEVLAGQIAAQQKQFDAAVTHLRNAVRMEDALTYDEPPPWYHSTRNFLGEALLQAARAGEAEATFREDLRLVRKNVWSLSGLERAQRAQGKTGVSKN